MDSCALGLELLELRRELLWEGHELGDSFHASTDKQAVRDRVFQLLGRHDFQVIAQIMEKSKAQSQIRQTNERFYQYGWYYLLKFALRKVLNRNTTEFMVTAASIGTKRGQQVFSDAVNDVVSQTADVSSQTVFCAAAADPCLQIADYCTWAIQRKWERDDSRSYELIRSRIRHEYDLWASGRSHHY